MPHLNSDSVVIAPSLNPALTRLWQRGAPSESRNHLHARIRYLLCDSLWMSTEGENSPIPATGPIARPARLRDVAAAAFVSVSTASMALNGNPAVAIETRERVRLAAAALNYRPDATARALQDGHRSASVGLYVQRALTEDFESASRLFTHRLIRLITDSLAGQSTTLIEIAHLEDSRISELSILVVVGDEPIDHGFYRANPSTPVIVAGHSSREKNVVAQLNHDQHAIAADLTDHLLAQEVRSLSVIRFREPGNYSESGSAAIRASGEAAGLAVEIIEVGFSPSEVRAATCEAVVTGSDALFVMLPFPGAALAGVHDAKARAPEDVVVVGRGEGVLEAQTEPPTSSMSMLALASGAALVEVVGRVLAGESGIEVVLPHELTCRRSSMRVPSQSTAGDGN